MPLLITKVQNDRDLRPIKLDLVGAALVSLALGLFVFGLIESPNMGYTDIRVIGSIAVSLILGAFFIYYERRINEPLVPMMLFRPENFLSCDPTTADIIGELESPTPPPIRRIGRSQSLLYSVSIPGTEKR